MYRRIFGKVIPVVLILIISVAMSACSKIDELRESVEESKSAGVSAEDGWTINDDGTFVYVVIVENTSDKTLSRAVVQLNGLDEEGNVLNDPELDPGVNRIGPLFPGEKCVVTMDSECYREDGSSLWPDTPSSFSYSISDVTWGEIDTPQIVLSDYAKKDSPGSAQQYTFTLENVGTEDFDWSALKEQESSSTVHMYIYDVVRDNEGKIIGGGELYLYGFEEDTGYPVIPAGGKVTSEGTGSDIYSGSDFELYITRVR